MTLQGFIELVKASIDEIQSLLPLIFLRKFDQKGVGLLFVTDGITSGSDAVKVLLKGVF